MLSASVVYCTFVVGQSPDSVEAATNIGTHRNQTEAAATASTALTVRDWLAIGGCLLNITTKVRETKFWDNYDYGGGGNYDDYDDNNDATISRARLVFMRLWASCTAQRTMTGPPCRRERL